VGTRKNRLRVIQPAEIRLHRGGYQRWRLASLTVSVALVIGVPLWSLLAIETAGAGLAGGGFWVRAAEGMGLPRSMPPFVGAPTAFAISWLEFLDPTFAASVALSGAASMRLLWSAIPALLLVALLGRFFCGWICPYVPILAVSNGTRALLARLGLRTPDLRLPRRMNLAILLALVVATAASGTQLIALVYPPAIVSREVFRSIFFGSAGVGVALVVGGFLFDTFVTRAGVCRHLCPGGALFSLLATASVVTVRRDEKSCTECTLCDVVCNLLQAPMSDRIDAGCERCGKCVAACPTDALSIGRGP
jgi:ferredoxin-type protein NapH